MFNPFSPDFDPTAALQHSPSGDEEDVPGSLDDFERALARDLPEVAQLICELDQQQPMVKQPVVERSKK